MSEYIVDVANDDATYKRVFGKTPGYLLGYPVRERIVRCRDCKYLDTPDWDEVLAAQHGEPPASCMRPDGDGDYMRFEIEPDGFCKWGERK